MRLLILCCILLIAAAPTHTRGGDEFSVAVTIKPLHALVAGIMHGAGTPALVMSGSASPHHYTLRPSERRALSEASLVFWIGPQMESFMPRILRSMNASTPSVALIEADGLTRLPARSVHHHADVHADIDPHIWLSGSNAHALVDAIADALGRHDPGRVSIYESNRKRLHRRISETDRQIRQLLSGKTAPFLSYHDAYQYFETEYGLNNAGFVSGGDEVGPGARRVRELRETIRRLQVHCLFYEAPNRPALVDTLVRDLAVEAHEFDAMGIRRDSGEDAWFEIMTGLARTGAACL